MTEYVLRISDWSSDVCSSDLTGDIDRRIRLLNDEAVAIIENLKTGITQGQEARTGASEVTSALEVISQFVRQFEHRTARVAERVDASRVAVECVQGGLETFACRSEEHTSERPALMRNS